MLKVLSNASYMPAFRSGFVLRVDTATTLALRDTRNETVVAPGTNQSGAGWACYFAATLVELKSAGTDAALRFDVNCASAPARASLLGGVVRPTTLISTS
jgi:hypothetical protein